MNEWQQYMASEWVGEVNERTGHISLKRVNINKSDTGHRNFMYQNVKLNDKIADIRGRFEYV